ncbi:glycosyltransferase family 2 protein [Fabibacter sp. E12]|nr:glycosyltransferase family 2 protein [Roseivirga sp. E12]MBO3699735.1 glycosyltransferase family 2 protein [Roseivirga sp. E12]
MASVAIVIVNWNSYSFTCKCLKSIKTLEYPSYKVIVVDNGSDDGSGEKLKLEFSNVIFLQNDENQGFTGGNNTGIQYALDHSYDYVMLLNNDTIITPNFLSPLVKRMEGEDWAAIQPKIMYNYDRGIIWNAGGVFRASISKPITRGEGVVDNGQFNNITTTEWITGCCFLIKSDQVRSIGLLDERFFIYYEDLDWSLKLRRKGLKLGFEPKSVIYHEAGRSDINRDKYGEGNVSPFSHYQNVRNHLFIVRRYASGFNAIGSWCYQAFKLLGYITYFLLRGRFKKVQYTVRGAFHGLIQ